MADGFVADPKMMQEYANQVGSLAGQFAEASGAANTVLNENAWRPPKDLEWASSTVNGQFDRAYGVVCQPAGQIMQEIQGQMIKALTATLGLMQDMQRKLAENATNYRQVDEQNASLLKKSAHPVNVPGKGGPE
ncbi:MAG TPA: hypothetical protein VJ914_41210 [Pseudonocardiaceae bacterium]|nr:hypothetical protein [Pseudonocardiaceae bacterium]